MTNFFVNNRIVDVIDLEVIDDAGKAQALLDPMRAQVLAALAEPGSATTVAAELGESRQKVNYHLRELEKHGLVRLVEERPRRGVSERIVVASAAAYVVSPAVLGEHAPDPDRTDRLSASYLLAVAARTLREVGELARGAASAGRMLPTLTIDSDIRFANAAARAEFTAELTEAVHRLAAKYHDESARGGRWHRLVVAAHPRPTTTKGPDHG